MYPTYALQPGSTDTAAVKQLQDYLVSKGYLTEAQKATGYGIYGPQTTQAVLDLQKSLGIDYSSGPGYWGPRTLAALSGSTSTPTTTQTTSSQPTTTSQPTTSTTQPTQTTSQPTSSYDLSQYGLHPFTQDTVINGVTIPAGSYKDENNKPVNYVTNDVGQRVIAVDPTTNSYYVSSYGKIGQFVNGRYVGYVGALPSTAVDIAKATAQPTQQAAAQPTQTIQPPTSALQPGNTGDSVKQLQDYLVSIGLMTRDQVNTGYGTYGPQTTAAVLQLQKQLGIDYSSGPGYFGPRTIAALQTSAPSTPGTQPTQPGAPVGTQGGLQQGTPTGTQPGVGGAQGGQRGTMPGVGTPTLDSLKFQEYNDPYAGLDPVAKQVKIYQDAYNGLGLSTIKQQYESYLKQEADLNKELQDRVLGINNNPWLSEGIRVKQIEKMQDSYRTRLDTLSHLMQLSDSLYKQGLSQVDGIVNGVQADLASTAASVQKINDAITNIKKDNSVQSVGGRELLINNVTGEVVADLGPSSPSSSTGGQYTLSPGQTRYDASGNIIASVPKSTTTSTATSQKEDINSAVSQLQQIVKQNQWWGVNPDDYQQIADYLQQTYGTGAVGAFKTALGNVGLQIDYVGDGKGAN